MHCKFNKLEEDEIQERCANQSETVGDAGSYRCPKSFGHRTLRCGGERYAERDSVAVHVRPNFAGFRLADFRRIVADPSDEFRR